MNRIPTDVLERKFEILGEFLAIKKIVKNVELFQPKSDIPFRSHADAVDWAHQNGYAVGVGCFDKNYPIGLANANKIGNIAKWIDIDVTEWIRLDGLILSKNFRDGNIYIIEFFQEDQK